MIQIPDNFPSYTAYNAKQLLQHVDTLKAAIKELQEQCKALLLNDSSITEQLNALNQHILELKQGVADLDQRVEVLESGTAKASKAK